MKVFIGSTYKDLIDYRVAAILAVEGTSYQAIKMEVFGARSDEPIVACLKEIEQSDLFVGVYAHRYGHLPDGSAISITEMEYNHAKELKKPCYCFVVNEEQPWPPKMIEGEPGASKLTDFKAKIGNSTKRHTCDYFTTPDDLRAKVANALSHFVANYPPITNNASLTYPHRRTLAEKHITQQSNCLQSPRARSQIGKRLSRRYRRLPRSPAHCEDNQRR